MLPTRKALKLVSAKSLCWLLSLVAMLILVNSLCEVCVSLGFSYFLTTDLLRQYTGLKAKVMAAFPERVEIKENMQSIRRFFSPKLGLWLALVSKLMLSVIQSDS